MTQTTVYQGIVRDGKIVLTEEISGESTQLLPEGTLVEIRLPEHKNASDEEENWRRQSEDSWATITWGAFE